MDSGHDTSQTHVHLQTLPTVQADGNDWELNLADQSLGCGLSDQRKFTDRFSYGRTVRNTATVGCHHYSYYATRGLPLRKGQVQCL